MPLPVAHSLLGATVVGALTPDPFNRKKELLLGALLGVVPDFDYLLNQLPNSSRGWHHGFTHSFVFALVLGTLTALCVGKLRVREVLIYSLATLSHPLLDFVVTESHGIALLWPFTDQRFKLLLPGPITYSWRTTSFAATVLDLLKISLTELLIFAPVLCIVLWFKRPKAEAGVS